MVHHFIICITCVLTSVIWVYMYLTLAVSSVSAGEDHDPGWWRCACAGGWWGLDSASWHRPNCPQEPSPDAHQRPGQCVRTLILISCIPHWINLTSKTSFVNQFHQKNKHISLVLHSIHLYLYTVIFSRFFSKQLNRKVTEVMSSSWDKFKWFCKTQTIIVQLRSAQCWLSSVY